MVGSDWFWYGADALCVVYGAFVVYRFNHRGVKVPRTRDPEKVAEKLLFEFLTPQQKKEWKERSKFRYTNPKSGRTYEIGGNVYIFHEMRYREWRQRGFGPVTDIPKADVYLAQLLSLMANESEVQRIACGG